jgi:hypothetical protein
MGKSFFGFKYGVSGVFQELLYSCMSSAADGHVTLFIPYGVGVSLLFSVALLSQQDKVPWNTKTK